MKKYVKPEMFYERFELSQHIADCGWEMTNSTNREVCTAVPDLDFPILESLAGFSLFTDGNDECTLKSEGLDIYCYQNGSNSAPSVFAS